MSCGRKGFIGLEIRYGRLPPMGDVKTEGMPSVIVCTGQNLGASGHWEEGSNQSGIGMEV